MNGRIAFFALIADVPINDLSVFKDHSHIAASNFVLDQRLLKLTDSIGHIFGMTGRWPDD